MRAYFRHSLAQTACLRPLDSLSPSLQVDLFGIGFDYERVGLQLVLEGSPCYGLTNKSCGAGRLAGSLIKHLSINSHKVGLNSDFGKAGAGSCTIRLSKSRILNPPCL